MAISKTNKAKLRLTMPNNCWYCGEKDPSTIDHVNPTARGGSNSLDNLVLSCKSCNSSKRDLKVDGFRFHCSWKKTRYSKFISSIDASRLMSQGVKFEEFKNNHKFWFEGKI